MFSFTGLRFSLLSISIFALAVSSATPPPRLGPVYLSPRDLTSNASLFSQAWQEFKLQLKSSSSNSSSNQSTSAGLDKQTFSIGVFSLHDQSAAKLLQLHHTGSDVRNSAQGVKTVDENSIYRLGSVSKLLTVYTTLLAVGFDYWSSPIANHVAGLVSGDECENDSIVRPQWCHITLGSLAGQVGGILRDFASIDNELTLQLKAQGINPSAFGIPAPASTNGSDELACARYQSMTGSVSCPTDLYMESIAGRPPVYPPWHAPSYSNSGFDLLGLAVENITGQSFGDLMQHKLFDPLNMSSTFYSPPSDLSQAVIPGNGSSDSYTADYQGQNPSGGVLSCLTDMSRLGVSILNSTLLHPQLTNEWLKPVTHTSSLRVSVGRPWEIYRLDLPNRTTDLYTKSGGISDYSAYFVLSPDHDVGFTVLGASTSGIANTIFSLTQELLTTMIPILEQQAAKEAAANLAGTYTLASSSSAAAAAPNTSLTLSINPLAGPGLHITSFLLHGTDFLSTILPLISGGQDSISLLPTTLESSLPTGGKEISFRASFASSSLDTSELGPVLQPINVAWSGLDRVLYGGVPIDWFVVRVDGEGRGREVEMPALGLVLEREG